VDRVPRRALIRGSEAGAVRVAVLFSHGPAFPTRSTIGNPNCRGCPTAH